jgi:hypothetical protein
MGLCLAAFPGLRPRLIYAAPGGAGKRESETACHKTGCTIRTRFLNHPTIGLKLFDGRILKLFDGRILKSFDGRVFKFSDDPVSLQSRSRSSHVAFFHLIH